MGKIMNEYTLSELTIGLTESFTATITTQMEDAFRTMSGDENPLHKDDDFAREVSDNRFEGHVTFGMLTASLYSRLAGMYLPGKYSLIHSFDSISFKKPVFAGDVLTVTGKITDINEALNLIIVKATVKNQNEKTVSDAVIKILVMK